MQIKLLLTNGKNATFTVESNFTVQQLKQHVSENWPKEWADEPVLKLEDIRILYRGRFLDDSTYLADNPSEGSTVESLKLSTTEVTTMHLVPKPANNHTGDKSGCKCVLL